VFKRQFRSPFDLKRKPPYPPKPRRRNPDEPWSKDMTLCIAAISMRPEPCIILVADTQVETDISSAEIEVKVKAIKAPNWIGMFSGVVSNARELLARMQQAAAAVDLALSNTQDLFQKAIWSYKDHLVESYLRSRFSLSFKDFQQNEHMPENQANEAWIEIERINTECDLILAGFIDRQPYLFSMEQDQERLCPEHHFAAIGSGSTIGRSMLYFRRQNRTEGLDKTIYHLYEAKKMGENSPGVGSRTLMFRLTPQAGLQIIPETDKLKGWFAKLGPQPTDAIGRDEFPVRAFIQVAMESL
jgi:20S proteasome alpha/beta subunit